MGFIGSIENFFKGGIKDVESGFKYGIDTGKDVVEHTEDSFTSVVSMPLLLIAGGFALFMWNSNLGQTQELQKSIGPALMMG